MLANRALLQKILSNVVFNVKIASDGEIRSALLKMYSGTNFLYHDYETMIEEVQMVADLKRNYYNQLYDTTKFDYNPLENYRMNEVTDTELHSSGSGTLSSSKNNEKGATTNDNYSENRSGQSARTQSINENTNIFGYNTTSSSPDGSTSETQNESVNTSDNTGSTRTLSNSENETESNSESTTSIDDKTGQTKVLRYGNIGVMTTQQMIQQTRELILNLLESYCHEFSPLFLLNTWF